jgi:uncharacterized membrane protein YbaN (DUF454 family)
MTQMRHPKIVRGFFGGFGMLCVGIGFVGLVTPGLPGFVFFIIALWAFRNSSERLANWLLNNKYVGATLRDWDENRSIKKSTKIIAITSIWVAIGFTIYRIAIKPPLKFMSGSFEVPKAIPIGLLVITILWLTHLISSIKNKV